MALFGITQKKLEEGFQSLTGNLGNLFRAVTNPVAGAQIISQGIRNVTAQPTPPSTPPPTPINPQPFDFKSTFNNAAPSVNTSIGVQPSLKTFTPTNVASTIRQAPMRVNLPKPNFLQQFLNERVQGYKEAPIASGVRDLLYLIQPQFGAQIDYYVNRNNKMLADKQYQQQTLNQIQQAEDFAKKIPRANWEVKTGNSIIDFLANLPVGYAKDVVNIPSNIATGSVGYQKAMASQGTQNPMTVTEAAKATAPLFEGAFTAGTLGTSGALKQAGKEVLQEGVKQGAKQAIKQGIKEGAKQGALYGGTYGAIQGVKETPSNATTPELIKNIALTSATQGAAGSVLGGITGGAGATGGFYINKARQASQSSVLGQLSNARTPQEVNTILKSNNFELPTSLQQTVSNQIAGTTNKKQISGILNRAATAADAQTQRVAQTTTKSSQTLSPVNVPLQMNQPTRRIQLTNISKLTPEERSVLQLAAGEKQATNITANVEATMFSRVLKKAGLKEPAQKGYQSLIDIQNGKYDNTEVGQIIRRAYDSARNDAIKAGFDVGYLDNYLPQIWKQSDKKIGKILQAKGIQTQPGFANSRNVPSYQWGIENGLKPRYKDSAQLYGAYIKELENAKANLNFINNLQQNGIVTTAANVPKNNKGEPLWKVIDVPGFVTEQQKLYADPRVVDVLKSVYSPPQGILAKGVKWTAAVNSTWQNITLGGGIPFTPLNFFTFGQMFKESATALGGTLGLLKGDTKGIQRIGTYADLIRSFSPELTNNQMLANQDLLKGISKYGANIRFADKINKPNLFHRAIDEPTFGRFLPLIELRTARSAFNEAIRKGLSKDEAYRVAATATKAYHGMSNAAYKLRSQEAQNIIGTLFFAPQYREALLNVYGDTAKAFVPGQGANKDLNRYMAAGLGMMYLIYNEANKALNDGKNMWENEPGKEMSLQIPYGEPDERGVRQSVNIPFAPSLLTIPRNVIEAGTSLASGDIAQAQRKVTSNLSMPLQTIGQMTSNQDYFGRPIYTTEAMSLETGKPEDSLLGKIGKSVGYGIKQALPPAPRGIYEYAVEKKPIGQAIATGLELPIRYGKITPEQTKSFFNARSKELGQTTQDARRRYNDRHAKNVNETPFYNNVKKASDMIGANGTLTEDYQLEKRIATREGGKYGYDPLYDLPDDRAFVVLKLQQLQGSARNDASAKQIKANNPWLQDFYDKRAAYFDKQNIPEQDRILPKFPEPTTALQNKLDQYNNLPKEQKGSFLKANPDITQFFNESFDYTNEMRRMQGVPEFAKRPQPSPGLQRKLDTYNSLAKGTGDRSRFLKANPDVIDFFNQVKIFNESGPFGTGVFAGGGGSNQTMEQILAEIQRSNTTSGRSSRYRRTFYQPSIPFSARRPSTGVMRVAGGRQLRLTPGKVVVRQTKA